MCGSDQILTIKLSSIVCTVDTKTLLQGRYPLLLVNVFSIFSSTVNCCYLLSVNFINNIILFIETMCVCVCVFGGLLFV